MVKVKVYIMLKTIVIFSGYHLPHLGGIERYTDNLSKELVKNGYKVIIISSDFEFNKEYTEKEVNEIILKFHDDFCTIRRDMISEHIMEREGNIYRLK